MNELSLHILDLAQNSIAAGASRIRIDVEESTRENRMTIIIEDDGGGMDEDFLSHVTDPFTTTRTTRKVGLGIPLMQQNMQLAGGDVAVTSEKGKGTRLTAWCELSNIDRLPLGNIADTIYMLVIMNPTLDFTFSLSVDEAQFVMDTMSMREILGDIPLNNPDVSEFIRGFLREGLAELPAYD